MNKGTFGRFLFGVVFVALAVAFVWVLLSYLQVKEQVITLTDPEAQQELNRKEVEGLITAVSKHIVLPENEDPVVMTIQDAEALASQQIFFNGSKNGNKVLVYPEKAVIYDAENDILVNVGPVFIEGFQVVKLDVRNGSRIVGKAKDLGDSLDRRFAYEVVGVDNAANFDYQGTVLVNLAGLDISALEAELGVTAVAEMPEGEAPSDADVVIIVGESFANTGAVVEEPAPVVEEEVVE